MGATCTNTKGVGRPHHAKGIERPIAKEGLNKAELRAR